MGLPMEGESSCTHKVFLITNYILLGAASSCIFLTLSLRLIPSLVGALLILLHIVTIGGAISGCAAATRRVGGGKFYGAHMVATVLTAIFQGSIAVLIFTRPEDFLARLDSYVLQDDGVLILKLAGGSAPSSSASIHFLCLWLPILLEIAFHSIILGCYIATVSLYLSRIQKWQHYMPPTPIPHFLIKTLLRTAAAALSRPGDIDVMVPNSY
ncbi:hypothetical protein SASPL_155934 [Salvia splendens]|uniref:Uncharacterized protein n=1 Tax=Salvia splendens TaxID=180675 RepID=A0A8X8VXR1_SALSN|nr:hypothetical protein SASPL_155934 [Salvia splendens]